MTSEISELESSEEFRRKVRKARDREWVRDSLRLREKTPEETISIMFDLVNFMEKIRRAEKCEA